MNGRTVWPSYREFQRAGYKSLHANITAEEARAGGLRRSASGTSSAVRVSRPSGPSSASAMIREYLAGRAQWPSREQFERDGRTALRNAINRTGGPDRWVAEFGVRRMDRRSGRAWTPEAIEAELERLIGEDKIWPSRRAFQQAGLYPMLIAIYRHEGQAHWAAWMNVKQRPGFGPRAPLWTEDRIRRELERFFAGRDSWPTEREFIEAGQRPLYSAASRNGGVGWWAGQLGGCPSPPSHLTTSDVLRQAPACTVGRNCCSHSKKGQR